MKTPLSTLLFFVLGTSFFSAIFTSAYAADSNVVPIDWSQFTGTYPNDANAELQKAISKNAIKYALNGWYKGRYGAQPAGEHYLDVLQIDGRTEFKVRGPATQALSIATVIKLGLYNADYAAYTGVSEQGALDICAKLARSVAYRHRANFDKGWGWSDEGQSEWQGALWAAAAGLAGWMTWELYNDTDKELIRRMVEAEANRRRKDAVPYYRAKDGTIVTPGDTKAEENAWNSNVLFLACAMMPHHENYDEWYKKAVELVISAYAHPNDVGSETIVNGKALKDWLHGSNTEENYAVVNHNIIHPDYSASLILNLWNAVILTLAGKPVPEGVFFNADKIYRALVTWDYPSPPYAAPGGTIYQPDNDDFYLPQGNDWGTCQYLTHGGFSAMIHAYGLDTGLAHDGAYWEKLYCSRAKVLQDRFDDGHIFKDDRECAFSLREEESAHENAQAILAKWAVRQPGFKITKDAPKEK